MLERLAKENVEKVRIVKVDVSKHRQWAAEEKVRGIPTFQIYAKGRRLEHFAGAYPENYLQQKIDRHFAGMESSGDQVVSPSEPAKEANAIKPMPKDWLPAGVTRE